MYGETPIPALNLGHMRDLDGGDLSPEVRMLCADGADPGEAWRAAARQGLVPLSWLDDRRRRFPDQEVTFFCQACNGMGATGYNYDDICSACDGRGNEMTRSSVPLPTDLDQVRWMVSRPGTVERAEALARQAVQRLPQARPDAPRPEVVQWGRVRKGRQVGTLPVVIVSAIFDAVPKPAGWNYDQAKSPVLRSAPWWREASLLQEITRGALCSDVTLAWALRAAGDRDSAMEPVLSLWELGVMVEELQGDAIVLDRARHRYLSYWRAGVPLTTTW